MLGPRELGFGSGSGEERSASQSIRKSSRAIAYKIAACFVLGRLRKGLVGVLGFRYQISRLVATLEHVLVAEGGVGAVHVDAFRLNWTDLLVEEGFDGDVFVGQD